MTNPVPFLVGFAGLAVLWLVTGKATGFNILKIFEGQDKRPSSSKFQFFLWTAAVVFGYLVVYATPDKSGNYHFTPLDTGLSGNLLIAMGISGATAVTAKAITSSNEAKKIKVKPDLVKVKDKDGNETDEVVGGVFQADDGTPDLGKIQMIVWTLIAVGVFLAGVIHGVVTNDPSRQLPDIGQPLMILMGLGHTAYVGKKIAGD
jgi:hypothetical protein